MCVYSSGTMLYAPTYIMFYEIRSVISKLLYLFVAASKVHPADDT